MRAYRGEAVYLPSLALHVTMLTDVEFVDCKLLGPAIVALCGQVDIDGVAIAGGGDLEDHIIEVPTGRSVVGAIGLHRVTLRRCTLEGIGFIGPQETMDALRVAAMA